MDIHQILSHFSKVSRTTRNGQYQCLCPAHKDRSASLSIKHCEDGRILINCFAGCDIESILGSAGLEFDDIIPKRIEELKPIGKVFNAYAVLKSLRDEALLVCLAALEIKQGKEIPQEDMDRLFVAYERLKEGYEYARR